MADLPPSPEDFGYKPPWAILAPAEDQVLYRITERKKPAINDFLSNCAKRKPQMRGESWLLYNGLSMFAEADQAAAIRDQFRPEQHVVEIYLPGTWGITLARTRRTPGHYSVWGRPETLLALALDRQGYPVDKEFQ